MSANQMNPIEPKLGGITCSDDYSQARRHALCSMMEVRSFQFLAIHFEPSNCCLELGELRCRMLFSRVVQLLGAEVAELGRLGTWRCRILCHLETLQPAHHHSIHHTHYYSLSALQRYLSIYTHQPWATAAASHRMKTSAGKVAQSPQHLRRPKRRHQQRCRKVAGH
jgi:hypothetical protein